MDEEEWKTAYDVQIYVTSLSAISDCNWNRLELWVNFHQDGFIYKLRHYYPVLSEDDIHWLCIRICIRLEFVFKFINVVLCNNKNDKLLFVLILWKNTAPYLM